MKKNVMVNGLPGKMAMEVAKRIIDGDDFSLVDCCLTGEEIKEMAVKVDSEFINCLRPSDRQEMFVLIKRDMRSFLTVDFTQPGAVNDNAKFYCDHGLPFVMGTTGGDRELLVKTVEASDICAVIAPNMASQVVALQAMMQYAAENFFGAFSGFKLRIVESHQKGKADPSGTAKAMIKEFNKLGIPFDEERIEMIRNPDAQLCMGIPEEHLSGHGHHTYDFILPDGSMFFSITHNINGRLPYVNGTLKALSFLDQKVKEGVKGKVFTMIDVLKG